LSLPSAVAFGTEHSLDEQVFDQFVLRGDADQGFARAGFAKLNRNSKID
jgi:hypothetical protein